MTKRCVFNFFRGFILLGFLFRFNGVFSQEQKTFNNLEEVLQVAKTKYYAFSNATIQMSLAELTKKAAWENIFNPRIPATAQAVDNLNQQVIFMPGEIFGQPAGTFREITTGQQFSTVFSIQPQFEIFNLGNIYQVKSAKINQQLTEVQNKINEQTVYKQINSIYFNILSFQGQIEILTQNIGSADTIFSITQQKFKENVGRKQEMNEAEVNLINLQNNLQQVQMNLKIQQESLALFFENEFSPTLKETVWNYQNVAGIIQTSSTLSAKSARLQFEAKEQEWRIARAQNLPTVSGISSFSWQNLSNDRFFSSNSRWIDYSYIGLKLSMDFPTTVSKVSNLKDKKMQFEMLENTANHADKEAESKNRQLILEYEKAFSQLENLQKIAVLKEDSYEKNFNQFKENILPLDKLLISHNDLLIAKLNVVSALANVGFSKSNIDINNKF